MAPAVVFDNVSKKFRRGERHDSFRDFVPALVRRVLSPRPASTLEDQEFWAVRDVSFAVEPGEGLAIIGPNGAGKSTTLKLLSRILKPTLGACRVRGRVGALIEVAAGFHPELTGRENAFLQGAIMGMKRPEIVRHLDEIVEFAGLEPFMDTPVKRYSSGMNARLGFSIAVHLNPDVLIIDEILSVGDMQFQQKCIQRMIEFKSRGTAIVFVSHNLQAVAAYFDRAVLLDRGEARFVGNAAEAVARYAGGVTREKSASVTPSRASIVRASLQTRSGAPATDAAPGDELSFVVTHWLAGERNHEIDVGFYLTDAATGTRLFNATSTDLGLTWQPPSGPCEITVEYAFRVNLLRGAYLLTAYVRDTLSEEVLDRREPAAHLTVHEAFSRQGNINLDVQCRYLASGPPSTVRPGDDLVGSRAAR